MSFLVLKGGRILDPKSRIDRVGDLWLRDGKVIPVEAATQAPLSDTSFIDCTGWWVMPGLIDPHVHLRDPGFPAKETILSGLNAAVAGGFTTVAAMANTSPVNDTPDITEYMLRRATEARAARLVPVSAVTRGLAGGELVDVHAMTHAGARLFSDDGMPIDDEALLARAFATVASNGFVVSLHEEDRALTDGGALNEGSMAEALGVMGIPPGAEVTRVRRDLAIAREVRAPVHIAHVSTAAALDLVRAARADGLQVTCEATPHHFSLDDSAVVEFGPDARMAPPLRSCTDCDAIRAGLADGTIDMIATDHAPHDSTSKNMECLRALFPRPAGASRLPDEAAQALAAAANGIIGLETALGLALQLVHDSLLGPMRLVELMSLNPARLLRLDTAGTLAANGVADITVVNPNYAWTVDPARFQSLSRNTPFAGMKFQGKAMLTIVEGEIVYDGRSTGPR